MLIGRQFEAAGETHFTNGFDPEPRARAIVNFPEPDTLARTIRAAERSRRAASFKPPRRSPRDGLHSLVAIAGTQLHDRYRQAPTQSI